MTSKAIIFDASTLISLSMNGLLGELESLKKIFSGKFIITKDVKREVIDKPITIKRFELEALQVKDLLDRKVIEMPVCVGVKDEEISKITEELKGIANNTFMARGRAIKIIDSGETSCLAVSKILSEKKIESVIALDERTLRMLCEKPENVDKLFQRKLHSKVTCKSENFKFFKGFKFIRSSELIYVAYKKGIIKLKGSLVLDALLYALKFKGCAISGDEIREIKAIK